MRELQVADDEAWLAALGVLPQDRDGGIREVSFPVGDVAEVQITWNLVDSSVRVRHRQGGQVTVDVYREVAILLTVARRGASTQVLVEYGADGWTGRTSIQLLPEVTVEDTVLSS